MKKIEIAIAKIKEEFGADMPISGGYGSSFDDAIIIDETAVNYTRVEQDIINLIPAYSNDWFLNVKGKFSIKLEGKYFDIINVQEDTKNDVKFETDLYFNVTKCWFKKKLV